MRYILASTTIAVLLLIGACSPSQHEYTTGDARHFDLIVRLLEKRKVPFQQRKTTIIYSSTDQESIDRVLLRVRKFTSLRFENQKIREHFYSLLEQRDIEYLVATDTDSSEVIFWPKDRDVVKDLVLVSVEYRYQQGIEN